MPIYMKYDGIDGSVTQAQHKNWIELQSCAFSVSRNVNTAVGAAQEREAGHPNISEIQLSKEQDKATGDLMKEAITGLGNKNVQIDFVSTENQSTMTINLEKALITSYSNSGSGGGSHGPAHESLTLNFVKVIFTPTTRAEGGVAATAPKRIGYDMAEAKPF